MVKKMAAVGLAFASFISAVSAQNNKLIIHAVIRDLPADSVVYWNSVSSESEDSVKTVSGGFNIEATVKSGEGNIYLLQIGRRETEDSRLVLYLEEGNIMITGMGPQFRDAKFSGSLFAVDYNDFLDFTDHSPALKNQLRVYAKASEFARNKDTAALRSIRPQLLELDSIKITLCRRWIERHASSPISSYVLYFYIKSKLNRIELDSMLNFLKPEAKDNLVAKGMINSIKIEKKTTPGSPAIEFTQSDTTGHPVSLKEFRGKYVLLDFWASWCYPCRKENPIIVAAYKKFSSKNFTVLGVSLDQPGDRANWVKAIRDDGLVWTQVSDLNCWNNTVAKLYDIQSVPSNFLIDPGGIIIARNLRGDELDKKLTELLGRSGNDFGRD